MKVVIVEDEHLAARRLAAMIHTCDPTIEIVTTLESVEEAVGWFQSHPVPDLVFLDIHLDDGLSFAIFEKVKIDAPIIFTTAFDEYAIKAFKLKSIDYLLKPIAQDDLNNAIAKFRNWASSAPITINMSELLQMFTPRQSVFRDRFSVNVGQKLKSIAVNDIAYFFSTSGITFVVMKSKNQYAFDTSLDNLADVLDPGQFFRVNRQYFVHLSAIAHVHIYPKSRLKLELAPPPTDDVYVSLDKVTTFKQWLDGRGM